MTNQSPPIRKGGSCMHRIKRILVLCVAFAFTFGLLSSLFLWYTYQKHVVDEPGAHIEASHIQSIIAQESPVYYRDRETRIGVFFGDEHRQSLAFDEIPFSFQVAIVAAEDGSFWSHSGINIWGIARAMWSNVKARRLVAGGSTITQQTAKNLYYRPDRSLKSKWTELVNALRLEAHHSKQDILSYYANQFHVHGNGRGLGIAARYFFDRDLTDPEEEWGLLESAYVAGLVKGPSLYDPFMGSEERQRRSRERAMSRTRYVLQRIVDEPIEHLLGPVTVENEAERTSVVEGIKAESQRLLDDGFELPFKRGVFRYDSSAVLDEVKRRLGESPFDEVLAQAGVTDPRRAGLVVVTTLDPAIQRESTYALWHHLTSVGAVLEDGQLKEFIRTNSRGPRFEPKRPVVDHEFRVASLGKKQVDAWPYSVTLDLGGRECVLDAQSLERVAKIEKMAKLKTRRASVKRSEIKSFVKRLPDTGVVWVSVKGAGSDGRVMCDLERRPELQGAALVLENGEIRAMVGGNDNRNFNRSTALRQMGSTWKPLIYHAAMELGWRPEALLDNTRNVFPFSTTYYYPRPDHSPASTVSLSWAGVNSENLASIWLLYHLMDNLEGEEVRVLATNLGLAKTEGETSKEYRTRIQKAGVLPTRLRLKEQNYLRARQDVLQGINNSAFPEDALPLSSMLYGWGYGNETERVSVAGGRDMGWKLQALENAWLPMSKWIRRCETQYRALASSIIANKAPPQVAVSDLSLWQDGDAVHVSCGAMPAGFVPVSAEALQPLLITPNGIGSSEHDTGLEGLKSRLGLGESDRDPADLGPRRAVLTNLEAVLVQGRLHLGTLMAIESALTRINLVQASQGSSPDLYEPDILYWHQDFRVLLAMRYVAEMARQYGVRSKIPPVLSMPLGASEITLEEATSIYSGLVTGSAWSFPGAIPASVGWSATEVDPPPAPALLISEVLDVDGKVIYRADPKETRVAKVGTGEMTSDILRNVVQHGTGRRASRHIFAEGTAIPVGGKTGTTNEYRNAAFLGFAPSSGEGGYVPSNGYIIGSYVGYDDNRPMTRGNVRIAGSSGALPVWIGIVQALQAHGFLGVPGHAVGDEKPTVWDSTWSPDLHQIPVDPKTGVSLPLETENPEAWVLTKRPDPLAELVFRMLFEQSDHPVRMSPSTDSIPIEKTDEVENPGSIWEP